ncbi:uncharacterized protein LOC119659614 isoform X2 [Hermetia illucens]|uniref:uncharacterized protein LOC119659614 isoform X2 n=1 Tax=Hermetia illucens TaxID=343691 RepID=UPI0018CC6DCB|nr:uncharacterized protein LOC119659614 isoform X2 [Hermetia illucens]
MLKNRICLVLVLIGFCGRSHSQVGSSQVSPRAAYDLYRASLQPNQQPQANAMPIIVKDVNYRNIDRNQESSCVDKKLCSAQKSSVSVSVSNDETGKQSNPPPPSSATAAPAMALPTASAAMTAANQNSQKLRELQKLVQQLYVAQAQVQLEATEIQRSQTIAAAAQQALEEAGNNVRVITAALHAAQETVAACALRAQTAQLQLAAHDQLLFTARQRVDALSAQMVGLQAEEGIGENKIVVDIPALLAKLKEPLAENQKPTPVPSILGSNSAISSSSSSTTITSPERSVDPNKFFDQLKLWNERNARKPDAITDRKQPGNSFHDGAYFERYGLDSLEENSENSMNDEIQKIDNSEVSVKSKANELTEDDLRTLVEFIRSSQQESPKKRAESEEIIAKNENEKYFDDFLNGMKNVEMPNAASLTKENFERSSQLDPRLSDRILRLHESLFHPVHKKQITLENSQKMNEVETSDSGGETNYLIPDESHANEDTFYP